MRLAHAAAIALTSIAPVGAAFAAEEPKKTYTEQEIRDMTKNSAPNDRKTMKVGGPTEQDGAKPRPDPSLQFKPPTFPTPTPTPTPSNPKPR